VRKLRAVLGDDSDAPRYIETLPRRGYRLLVPVAVAAGQGAARRRRPKRRRRDLRRSRVDRDCGRHPAACRSRWRCCSSRPSRVLVGLGLRQRAHTLAEPRTIAVLPLANLSA
jgi:hypothetical protein